MSFQITTAFVDQFKANILWLSQQKQARLRPCCRQDDQTGDERYVERVGATAMQAITTRHGDTPLISTPHSRRKLTLASYNWADLIDKVDKIMMLINPESTYAKNAVAAANRQIDDLIITALGGPAYSGHTGGTTVNNYASGECRLVDGDGSIATAGSDHSDTTATGLTVAKLLTCKQLLDEAEIEPDRKRYFVCNAANIKALLSADTYLASSAEYNTVRALVKGEINTFCGFEFISSERLLTDATETDCKNCFAFAEDAMVLGIGEDIITRITERSDKNYSTQVYVEMSFGVTRVEGPAVVEINLKTTG